MSNNNMATIGLKSPRDRYMNDPKFRSLVDLMTAHIMQCNFTPSEMREAAILASIRYEQMTIRENRYYMPREIEGAFKTIDDFIEKCGS